MQTITTIGLNIAKSIFQVHRVDAQGKVIVRRQLKRRYVLAFFQKLPPCLLGRRPSRRMQLLLHARAALVSTSKGRSVAPCNRPMVTWLTPYDRAISL